MENEARYRRKPLPDIAVNPMVAGLETPVIHALLCATDYGILMTDQRGNDILCNPRFGELFDLDPDLVVHSAREEVRRIALSRVKDPDEFNAVIDQIYSEPLLEREDEIEVCTDPPRTLRRYTGPVFDATGQNIGRVWTFQDVTETRALQRAVAFYTSELERQLQQQHEDYEATSRVLDGLNAITAAVASNPDEESLLARMTRVLCTLPEYSSAAILLNSEGELRGMACGLGREPERILLRAEESQVVSAAMGPDDGRPVEGAHLVADAALQRALHARYVSVGTLLREGEPIGVVLLGGAASPRPHAQRATHLAAIRDQVALALKAHYLHASLRHAYDELRSAQEQMIEAARLGAVGTLAAGIAHDIRNIITPLQVELAMAADGGIAPAVRAQVDRLSALTHRLLAISKPSSVNLGPLYLDELIGRIAQLVEPQADVENVRIDLRFGDALPPAIGDGGRLEHLFINLFLNALNAMSARGGTLTVTATEEDNWIRVDVSDTGDGIAAASLPRLFEPFYTTRKNGTGLGLFSVKRIVDEHGGRIDVASGPGQGTTFTVRLRRATLGEGGTAESDEPAARG